MTTMLLEALQKTFPTTRFRIKPAHRCAAMRKPIIYIEWQHGPHIGEVRALVTSLLKNRERLHVVRCKKDEDRNAIVWCPRCNSVI
jgi:hypothetical protein